MNIPWTDTFIHDLQVNAAGRWFLVGMAAVLGGIFGSFMNVVAYRLPLRMSLSRPGSHCPACQRSIRWYDNVPVLGWLRLGGRCRDCGTAISARYPLVEATVAIVGASLAWKVTGSWIPDATVDGGGYFQADVVRFFFHLLLLCTLISAALIEFDGQVPPPRLIWPPCAVGLLILALWPSLQPAGEWIQRDGVWAGLGGMVAALFIGVGPWLGAWMGAQHGWLSQANAALGELVLVGGFLGERAIVAIGVVSMAVYFATQLAAPARAPVGRCGWAGCLTVVTLVWVLVGRDVLPESPGFLQHTVIKLLAAAVLMTLMATVLMIISRRRLPKQG